MSHIQFTNIGGFILGKDPQDLKEEMQAIYVLYMHLYNKYGEFAAAYYRLTETIRSRIECELTRINLISNSMLPENSFLNYR